MSVCPKPGFLDSSSLSGCDLRPVYAEVHRICSLCWLLVKLILVSITQSTPVLGLVS